MKALKYFFLIVIGNLFFECSQSSNKELGFELDPDRLTFMKNRVTSYVSFRIDSGIIRKKDSLELDSNGNITYWKFLNDPFGTEYNMKYDTLNRVIWMSQDSDIHNTTIYKYELKGKVQFIQKEYLVAERDGSISEPVFQTIFDFDPSSGNVIKRTEIHLRTNDTSRFIYKYNKDGIEKEIKLPESDSVLMRYKYSNGGLFRVDIVSSEMHCTSFYSITTGLMDSTINTRNGQSDKIYYKYYFR